MIIPAARRAIVLASTGDLGERLGVFYAAYLAGFVFGPPVAGVLTVIADVRLPFLVFGIAVAVSGLSLRGVVVDGRAAVGATRSADRRVLRRLIVGRRVIAAMLDGRLVPLLGRRVRAAVGRPTWTRSGASTFVITVSLTVFALPMLVIAKRAGRLSDRRPAAHVGAGGRRDGAVDGRVRLRRLGADRDADGHPARDRRGDPVPRHAGRGGRRRTGRGHRGRPGPRRGRRVGRGGRRCLHRCPALRGPRAGAGLADRGDRDGRPDRPPARCSTARVRRAVAARSACSRQRGRDPVAVEAERHPVGQLDVGDRVAGEVLRRRGSRASLRSVAAS